MKSFYHNGTYLDMKDGINQMIYLTAPSELEILPSYCYVFELIWLGRPNIDMGIILNNNVDIVVGWSILPLIDSRFKILTGKFKIPFLRGSVQFNVDKYSEFEQIYNNSLNKWLCNLELEIIALPRLERIGDDVYWEHQIKNLSSANILKIKIDETNSKKFIQESQPLYDKISSTPDGCLDSLIYKQDRVQILPVDESEGNDLSTKLNNRNS